jgi:hypothetical protein
VRRAVVVALLLVAAPARADLTDDVWKRGNDAYFRGDYTAAIAAYEQIDRQGLLSAELYYNLGVVYFRQGNLGRAVWSFERAVTLAPDDEDARFNLAQARKLAERRVRDRLEGAERDPVWIRVVTFLTASAQTWLFLVLYLSCFGLLFWRRRARDDLRPAVSASAALVGFAAVVAGLLLLGRVTLDRLPFGVVLPDVVAVKEGADPNYRSTFTVHAGLRVRLLERDQDWVRIRLSNGLEGWVRDQDVGRL